MKKGAPKPRRCANQGPRASTSWEEHGERVSAAIAIGTDVFLHTNKDRIVRASSTQAAKNSYVAGMIDMLSLARGALGFCGADMILLELERLNMRRFADEEESMNVCADSPGRSLEGAQGDIGDALRRKSEPKAAKVITYDPMFA